MTYHHSNAPRRANNDACDPRWKLLRLVQEAKAHWGLKDRDISVLRGLLSLVSAEAWSQGQAVFVYASNKVLQERCDGMDERTLRRRLQQLCQSGLIQRHISPNRKRYLVRDETGAALVSYGFDLATLRDQALQIEGLAQDSKAEQQRLKYLRKVLRDRLWHLVDAGYEAPLEYQRMLRNKISSDLVAIAIQDLEGQLNLSAPQSNETIILADNDSQIDRHIHNSNKEDLDKKDQPITLGECLEKAPLAVEYAPWPLQRWSDLTRLTDLLGPALDIQKHVLHKAQSILGNNQTAVMIMGLIQAGNHIRQPARYFNQLLRKAQLKQLDIRSMYLSLTRNHQGFRPETLCNA